METKQEEKREENHNNLNKVLTDVIPPSVVDLVCQMVKIQREVVTAINKKFEKDPISEMEEKEQIIYHTHQRLKRILFSVLALFFKI